MNSFSQFGITVKPQNLTGEKVKISKILNKPITVVRYEIKKSKFDGNCLYLQIRMGDKDHVIFTSSKYLSQMISMVPADKFPFQATIVEEDDRYQFE